MGTVVCPALSLLLRSGYFYHKLTWQNWVNGVPSNQMIRRLTWKLGYQPVSTPSLSWGQLSFKIPPWSPWIHPCAKTTQSSFPSQKWQLECPGEDKTPPHMSNHKPYGDVHSSIKVSSCLELMSILNFHLTSSRVKNPFYTSRLGYIKGASRLSFRSISLLILVNYCTCRTIWLVLKSKSKETRCECNVVNSKVDDRTSTKVLHEWSQIDVRSTLPTVIWQRAFCGHRHFCRF